MKERHNILLYTTSQPVPTRGGIEHATITTAHLLHSCGHKVYSIYKGEPLGEIVDVFNGEYSLQPHNLVCQISDYIREKKIDVVIIQSAFGMVKPFKKAIGDGVCKIITAYHFEPIWDKRFVDLSRFCSVFHRQKSLGNFFRLLAFPYLKVRHLLVTHKSFREGFRFSDKIVLLSKGYTSSFLKYVGCENDEKISIIPNALPSDMPNYSFQARMKEKILLIVARLDEVQKRIGLALEMWKDINPIAVELGWSLMIVGDGEARLKYENYIRRYQLKNVSLEGRQEPWGYYKRASVFLMTSRSEGWGITLLEAQKFGVVPVCYNTFAAAADIIDDKVSGFLIQEGDKQQYKEAVLSLMHDAEMRERMAFAGIEHVEKFSPEVVAKKWDNLCYSVIDR
jgi:glycosyltransferase involved in cell wall biosynthesis